MSSKAGRARNLDILSTISWGGGPLPAEAMVEGFLSVTIARQLRKRMSPTEVRLWRQLKLRPDGLEFRRQHPERSFVLDFYCKAAGLAIEVDGLSHDTEQAHLADKRRDLLLQKRGIATLRIAAEDVRTNLHGVVLHIVNRCLERTPPPRSARFPSPSKDGEDVA